MVQVSSKSHVCVEGDLLRELVYGMRKRTESEPSSLAAVISSRAKA